MQSVIQINKETVEPSLPWQGDLHRSHPLFYSLAKLWPFEKYLDWPRLEDYNQHYLGHVPHKLCWQYVKFEDESILQHSALTYEQMIYWHHVVPTRPQNWHDFFNFLTWLAWPKAKAALNRRTLSHYFHHPEYKYKVRQGALNHLARFEECGLVIVAPQAFIKLIQEHAWTTLFVTLRHAFHENVQVYIYGHGLYEKFLNPFVGLTGFAVMIESNVFLPKDSVDHALAQILCNEQNFQEKSFLQPFPLLGIPGIWPANQAEDFYQNENYFRKKRTLA